MEEVTAAAFGLFGREDDLRVLSDVLDGGGSAVAIGDPGVGKSSLLKVADQLAQRRGRRVLSVTPTQFDRGLPFAGLAELIAQCPEGADRAFPDPQRRGLAVALQRVEPDGREVDALAVPLAVQGLLTHLCESEPVALIIDDLQWLDQASLGSLGFALRRISVEPHRLSVLVGTRPEGAGTDLIRGLPEPRHEFTLPPLEDWAIGQLLRTRLGARWTPPMSAGVARVSSGNPFLALMIAQAMQSDVSKWCWSAQDGHDPVFPVPPSLAGLLGEKVTLLPQDARDVLLLVSAAGRLTVAQLQGIVEDAQAPIGPGSRRGLGRGDRRRRVGGHVHPPAAGVGHLRRRRTGRTSSRAPRSRGEARRPGGACSPPLEVDHGPRRGGRRRTGAGSRDLPGPWRSSNWLVSCWRGLLWPPRPAWIPRASLGRWLRAVDTYIARRR